MGSTASVVCIGELLIDFVCTDIGIDLVSGRNFEKQAGGAPANVCTTVVKLGGRALFGGKVGNDSFGHFLKNTLDELKVDTSMLVLDHENSTTLAFVSLKENGERDFTFHRGADTFYTEKDLDKEILNDAQILHFGSATALLGEPFHSTYLNTIKSAKNRKQFISFDPNFRADLWMGRVSSFVKRVKQGIALSDFVKLSEEELHIITGYHDLEDGVQMLHQLGAGLVTVTLGEKGTFLSNGIFREIIPSIQVKSIDSTGAGDAFVGAMLFQLLKKAEPKKTLADFEYMKRATAFSNKVGAIVCTKVGAISAIPTIEEVKDSKILDYW